MKTAYIIVIQPFYSSKTRTNASEFWTAFVCFDDNKG